MCFIKKNAMSQKICNDKIEFFPFLIFCFEKSHRLRVCMFVSTNILGFSSAFYFSRHKLMDHHRHLFSLNTTFFHLSSFSFLHCLIGFLLKYVYIIFFFPFKNKNNVCVFFEFENWFLCPFHLNDFINRFYATTMSIFISTSFWPCILMERKSSEMKCEWSRENLKYSKKLQRDTKHFHFLKLGEFFFFCMQKSFILLP